MFADILGNRRAVFREKFSRRLTRKKNRYNCVIKCRGVFRQKERSNRASHTQPSYCHVGRLARKETPLGYLAKKREKRMQQKGKDMTTLNGEDVCVCIGCCADDGMLYWVNKIRESRATTVVFLYNPDGKSDQDGVEKFVRRLEVEQDGQEQQPPRDNVRRQILIMRVDEWERFYVEHKDETYSIVHIPIDSSMASPSSKKDKEEGPCTLKLDDFDDMLTVKEELLKIVDFFKKPLGKGMWPSVLLSGETGSGKTYTAQKIYDALVQVVKSDKNKPKGPMGRFVALNCGELGREDINAALFGVKGGSFTGVSKDQPGAIANAKNGVLFLDEIGTLPMELQPRLLTILDGGKYRIHGTSEATENVECRFVFGTNEDLLKAVREGRFRFDLYNRINNVNVCIPSVQERIRGRNGENFLNRQIDTFCEKYGELKFTDRARACFKKFAKEHPWRGNFREFNRCFQIMCMQSDRRNIVSASAMERVVQTIKSDTSNEEVFEQSHSFHATTENSFLKGCSDIPANEKAKLAFAFKCAETSTNCADAGRRFYQGKVLKNPCSSFKRYIERFGFEWNANVVGHIIATESADN